ncbi:hypothetical protein [Actinoplanes sp. NPDC023714]|uniref:hypothetical protein n=1 Tax=Actinoplanes sp. NPDC023714 TaxID=3154322 RepID=UPI0033F5C2C8
MIKTATNRCPDTGITTISLAGELSQSGAETARSVIATAVTECPTAVLVDLSRVSDDDASVLKVFPAITYEAQSTWGVPVLLCEAGPRLSSDFDAVRGGVALYEHRANAVRAVRAYVPRWVTGWFPPVVESAAGARALTADACARWGLMHLRDTAQLVASELAANAVVHARTEFETITAYTGRYLRIAVRDGSPDTVVAAGDGRGLRFVEAVGTRWGVTGVPDGKIVWTLLRAHRW